MANKIIAEVPLHSDKTIKQKGGRNQKIKLEVNRNTVIRIKRDESRKQGDKNSHQRNGTNDRNSKDRRLQNSDTIQGDINCPCEPQRGIRSTGLTVADAAGDAVDVQVNYVDENNLTLTANTTVTVSGVVSI